MGETSLASLSRREKEVVGLLLRGMSNKQIALDLGVSERTVEFHLRNIYNKLQVASRVEVILKLGKTPVSENPVESTVVASHTNAHNDSQPIAQGRWAQSLRNTVSLIRQEAAMTLRIILEDLGNSLRKRPLLFSLILFLSVSASVRYALFTVGLYHWFSYILLGVSLGAGGIAFGLSWRKLAEGKTRLHPFAVLVAAALIPLLVTGLDEIILHTLARNMGQLSIDLMDMSNTAAWLVSPEGGRYLSTSRRIVSDDLWFLTMACTLLLFILGAISNKWFRKQDLTPA